MQTMAGGQVTSASSGPAQASPSMQNNPMTSSPATSGLSDIYRIQIEAGDLENNIASLKSRQNTILAQFNAYINRSPGSQVFTYDNLIIDTLDLSVMAVPDSMLLNNPMLGMLDYEKQSIEARKKMVTRMGYPMVGLGLNYSLINKANSTMGDPAMNGKDMIMPMVTVTLPVYRRKYNAMKTEAELMQNATAQNYQAVSNSLQTEYFQAIQLYQGAQRRIKLYDNQYKLASKSLDLMLKNFTVSSSGLTDVLRIRQQALEYEFRQAEAAADFNTALAWLKRLGFQQYTTFHNLEL